MKLVRPPPPAPAETASQAEAQAREGQNQTRTVEEKMAKKGNWTEEKLLELASSLPDEQLRLTDVEKRFGSAPIVAAHRNPKFGNWRQVVEAVGRVYPGRYRWRTKAYRADPERFKREVLRIPTEKLSSTFWFCKEQDLDRPVVIKKHLCERCKEVWVQLPAPYCEPCRKVVKREKSRERGKRWLANPANRAKVNEASRIKWHQSKKKPKVS